MSALEPGGRDTPGGASERDAAADAAPERSEPIRAVVRPAVEGDVERVSAIERGAFSDPWSRTAFERFVAERRDERVLFHVACLGGGGGRVVGYVVAWFIMDEGEVANLAVAPEARARGIGALLLSAVIAEARAREVATIYLEVRESNAAARALYASSGFAEIGRRRRYYRQPVEDALVLRLVLPAP